MVSGAVPLLSAVNGDTGTTTFAAKAITWQHFEGANAALLLYKNYKLIEMRYVTNSCKGGKALWLFVYRHTCKISSWLFRSSQCAALPIMRSQREVYLQRADDLGPFESSRTFARIQVCP